MNTGIFSYLVSNLQFTEYTFIHKNSHHIKLYPQIIEEKSIKYDLNIVKSLLNQSSIQIIFQFFLEYLKINNFSNTSIKISLNNKLKSQKLTFFSNRCNLYNTNF